jgi:glycosyltransferase involved in cell wall biosynthesis
MKILFISRAYPPIVGGIENQNYELGRWLSKIADVKIVANKKGKKFLPFFAVYAIFYILFNLRKYDVLLLGDGVLSVIGWKAKFFYKKPVICVVHGLDLTYRNKLYQNFWVKKFIPRLDKLVAVGNETVKVAIKKGIPKNKLVFIPNGVDTEKNIVETAKSELEKIIGENVEGKKIILTSGRLARRKGVAWFIEHVIPKLPENVIYVIAGNGPDKNNIQSVISKNNLSERVKMLGYVPDEIRNKLLNGSDLFIQPNIKIEGDMEGFGISVIEAAACRLPVVASELEGLKDAIAHEQNGFLIEPHNSDAYASKIKELLDNDQERKAFGERARQFVIKNFSWEIIAEKYLNEIEKTIHNFKF